MPTLSAELMPMGLLHEPAEPGDDPRQKPVVVEHPRKRGHKDEDRRNFEGDHRPVFAGKRLGADAAKQQ